MVWNIMLVKSFMVLVLCIVMAALRITSASLIDVGDTDGWRIGAVNYTNWVVPKKFYVGDTLLFAYSKDWHNVLQVTKSDYDSCKNSSAIATYHTGNDTVQLPKPGLYYYLCGVKGHCELGQKVAIEVLAEKGATAAPSPAASSPSPSVISKSSPSAHDNSTGTTVSKNNAPAKSAGYAFMAFMWASGVLSLCV